MKARKIQRRKRQGARKSPPAWWSVFIAEYLKNGQNATAAYLKVLPKTKPKTAKEMAHRLLTKVDFQEALKKAQAKVAVRAEMTLARWLSLLGDVAEFDIRKYLRQVGDEGDLVLVEDWKELPDGHAIETIEIQTTRKKDEITHQTVKLKRESKLRALEIMGKALGYLKETVEVSGSVDLATKIQEARKRAAVQSHG